MFGVSLCEPVGCLELVGVCRVVGVSLWVVWCEPVGVFGAGWRSITPS